MIDNYRPYHYVLANIKLTLISLFARMFSFLFLSLALHTKRVNLYPETAGVFSIAAQVFRNFFLKICPLFGQILITCLKCSRASFLPSSCSEKMRWGRGWVFCTLHVSTPADICMKKVI